MTKEESTCLKRCVTLWMLLGLSSTECCREEESHSHDDQSAMLAEANLPASFWGECLAALVHILNRIPTASAKNATPYELWHGKKPDVSHLRVWGCTAYVHVQKDKRTSLGPHMEKCVFLGYPDGYKGWKFYNPTTKKTVISEHADFYEH
jgi:hypothetical protein